MHFDSDMIFYQLCVNNQSDSEVMLNMICLRQGGYTITHFSFVACTTIRLRVKVGLYIKRHETKKSFITRFDLRYSCHISHVH